MNFDPASVKAFVYDDFRLDLAAGVLECRYRLDNLDFTETVGFDPRPHADAGAAAKAARLVFLLAGVSYYKAAAPPVIEFGPHALTTAEAALLRAVYLDGLAEYAYRNELDLGATEFAHRSSEPQPVRAPADAARPLVPFGGGIDSIVTVESVRRTHRDVALFVASPRGGRFEPLERAAAVTGLAVHRMERQLDPLILRSRELGYRNGHVPVTGIISALAVMATVLDGRGAVVMSNEHSASSGNLEIAGRVINHQWSKSEAFEALFRGALADSFTTGPDYFSLLRPWSELAIARRFAALPQYWTSFHSCNRAFHVDEHARQVRWCGTCDKCCFIDLILAPFMSAADLHRVFSGHEPLANPATLETFRTLVELEPRPKPFECVGDRDECRAAVQIASARPDRAGQPVLAGLRAELLGCEVRPDDVDTLFGPLGPHHIPDDYAPLDLLG